MKAEIKIPAEIGEIIKRLESAGFEAFIVGGCVRDSLMGLSPHDYDITTSALPEEVERVFADCRVVETGIKHGTVTVLFRGSCCEITTFRIDGDYIDSRRPQSVVFTKDLEKDLSRRDFTMNAIAYSPSRGLIDPFFGENDIKSGVIRCVGSPEKRFSEDALRILRALRFASSLGFEIEENTKKAVLDKKNGLSHISAERTFAELKRLLCGKFAEKTLIEYPEIITLVIPELRETVGYDQGSKYHNSPLYVHLARAVGAADENNENLRLAMLLHDIGKPLCKSVDENGECHYYGHAEKSAEMAEKILRRLKCDNASRERICETVRFHDIPVELSERYIKRRLAKFGIELLSDILNAHIADNMAKIPEAALRREKYEKALETAREISLRSPCLSLKDLEIGGEELSALVPPSPKMGEILKKLLSEVVDGALPNEKQALLARAAELLKNDK